TEPNIQQSGPGRPDGGAVQRWIGALIEPAGRRRDPVRCQARERVEQQADPVRARERERARVPGDREPRERPRQPATEAVTAAADLPIGVFDSGVGGLTVLRELRRQLPSESTIYLGDE